MNLGEREIHFFLVTVSSIAALLRFGCIHCMVGTWNNVHSQLSPEGCPGRDEVLNIKRRLVFTSKCDMD